MANAWHHAHTKNTANVSNILWLMDAGYTHTLTSTSINQLQSFNLNL